MTTAARTRSDLTPARMLPLLYFAAGYVALPLAFAAVAFHPRSLSGFYYHPRLIGVIHLVTLGWITSAILGALWLALPMLLRAPLPTRRGDYWAFGSFVIGVIGMVAHFWIEEPGGMAWSGLMVAAAILHAGCRVVPPVIAADAAAALKLPLLFGFANIGIAAGAGVILGFDKVHHFLPGYVVSNVLAHAHLAALGWASMMAIGLGYLSFPVMLAGPQPKGRSVAITAVVLEIASLGVGVSLLVGSRWSALFALMAAGAYLRFGRDLWRLRRHGAVAGAPKPDLAAWHVVQALLYAGAAVVAGIALAWLDPTEATARVALAYGVCGLVGFIAQLLMGIEIRLVPMAVWRWELAHSDSPSFSAHALASRPCAVPACVMWSAAVPLLAAGFLLDSPLLLSSGGAAACVATAAAGIQGLFVVASAFPRPRWISWRRADRHRGSAAQQLAVPPRRP